MATQRKIYRGGLVEGVSIPNVSFPQHQVMASGWQSLNQRLDAINTFAIKGLDVEMEEKGKKFAAENPISIEQFYLANPTDRENLVGGNKTTTFGKAIRATHINILAGEMAIHAQKDFMDLRIEAHLLNTKGTPMTLDQYKNRLDAVVDGYSDALLPLDADAAIAANAKLATTANSYYSSYADTLVKDHKKKQNSTAVAYGYDHIDRIKEIVNLGAEIEIIVGNETVKISLDKYLLAEKIRIRQEMIDQNLTADQIIKWSAAWDAEVIQQYKNYLFSEFVDTDDNYNKGVAHQNLIWEEVRKGSFNVIPTKTAYPDGADQETIAEIDKKNALAVAKASSQSARLQAIYESLDEDGQKEFRDKVKTWADRSIKIEDDKEKSLQIDKKTIIEDLEVKYTTALIENNYATAEEIVKEFEGIDNKKYMEYGIMLEEDRVEGKFNDLEVEAKLYEDLYFGNLEKWEIKNSYDVGQIDQDTRNDLLHKFNISKKQGFSKAKEYIRVQVGYAEQTLFAKGDEQSIAHKQYTDAVGELMNWMTGNPNASHTDIYNEGVRLVAGVNQEKDNQASIKGMKDKILNDTAVVAGKNVTGHNLYDAKFKMYFTGAWNENEDWYNGYNHNDFATIFLDNSAQITTLISELEEMRDLINKGGTYEVDKTKLWPGKTTTDIPLPKGVTAQNVTDIITDLNVLKGFYDKQ
jgi:hypothetical protein